MVRLTRIYTKTGDDGTTGLTDGSRLPKHHLRIESYGTVDELNSVVGLTRRYVAGELDAELARIQNDLFDLGADLSTPGVEDGLRVVESQVLRLERCIDAFNADLPPLTSFVLPGGSEAASWLHLARTVARRAERCAVALSEVEPVSPHVIPYLNRLSDLLFVLARAANAGDDVLWIPGENRDEA